MRPEDIVSSSEKVMSGIPVFAGTRVPVESLIAHLQAGDRLEDFLEGFPTVTHEQATAFLEMALKAAIEARQYARSA